MKRVYVAGAYSANNTLDTLRNMGRGMRAGLDVLRAGFAPFVPWFDYHFSLFREGETLKVEDYYNYSLAWLEGSEALLVLPNSENSRGTQAEIERAKELGIPIFYSLEDLWENMK